MSVFDKLDQVLTRLAVRLVAGELEKLAPKAKKAKPPRIARRKSERGRGRVVQGRVVENDPD